MARGARDCRSTIHNSSFHQRVRANGLKYILHFDTATTRQWMRGCWPNQFRHQPAISPQSAPDLPRHPPFRNRDLTSWRCRVFPQCRTFFWAAYGYCYTGRARCLQGAHRRTRRRECLEFAQRQVRPLVPHRFLFRCRQMSRSQSARDRPVVFAGDKYPIAGCPRCGVSRRDPCRKRRQPPGHQARVTQDVTIISREPPVFIFATCLGFGGLCGPCLALLLWNQTNGG